MSTDVRPEFGVRRSLRAIILAGAVLSLLFGIAVLVWPVKSAVAVTILLAVYAIIGGLLNLGSGIFVKGTPGWTRAGLIVLGLVFLAAGVLAFGNLGVTTLLLAVIFTTFLGIAWIVDGIVSLTTLSSAQSAGPGGEKAHKGWTIAFAIISIIAGVFVIISPLMTALWLWIFIGAALIVFGVTGIVRAATLEK
ncbi:HdeD family acid-resistance protein [Microbacterium sp. ZXX196]|uniref:HdeD family acid-resistance protein n=1 Tax=Microbacterium sp. ZXX196 TaxID=2609291 RepID=UPI0012B70550|nr:DUF308 domain-containing protein [Microbacterium sp. ZXX196]MTE23959.1 hypothetical protein [Microbacterium sp. ZXX196]